jgi:hypothetical protein
MKGMVGSATQTTFAMQILQAAPVIGMTTNNVVLLVKSMREMDCEPYIGEQYAEMAGRWFMKVEKTMIQISIPKGLRVNCAT